MLQLEIMLTALQPTKTAVIGCNAWTPDANNISVK